MEYQGSPHRNKACRNAPRSESAQFVELTQRTQIRFADRHQNLAQPVNQVSMPKRDDCGSGASMHMVSKGGITLEEQETIAVSQKPTIVITACGTTYDRASDRLREGSGRVRHCPTSHWFTSHTLSKKSRRRTCVFRMSGKKANHQTSTRMARSFFASWTISYHLSHYRLPKTKLFLYQLKQAEVRHRAIRRRGQISKSSGSDREQSSLLKDSTKRMAT